ncbi:hypothetical protein MVES_003230 [Malassezia vespertilionis]|uniref:Guided entry of tail-anchored proteins 1 n=1 Tax=Malassezia vespertilionis TaxID=2020962 RepID=A0A2N1J8B9_9BASI|nr:hypothetical protein MVES_003230 [Malassezia vespertilionis]
MCRLLGWYDSEWDPELGDAPCIFTSVTPAWNNTNLHRLAEKIKSPLVLLLAALPEPLFLFPQGHTDSEFAFALYLSHLKDPSSMKEFSCKDLKDAMLNTIRDINIWSKEAGIEEPSLMNFCVTDGQSIACTRYVSSKTDEAASLHSEGAYRMVKADRRQKIVVIASEPLTFEKGMHRCMNSLAADWMEVESNTILCITPNMNVLQYPILDEYHSPRSQMHVRNPNFAMRAGFHPNTHIAPEIREHIQTDSVCATTSKDDASGFYRIFVAVTQRKASRDLATMKVELYDTRQELNLTSAQDQFSKWAKLRRKVDKLTQQVEDKNRSLSSSQFTFGIAFKVFLFVLNTAVPSILTFYFRRSPMFYLPPGDWFGPLGAWLSWPKAPAGAVSSTVWTTVCGRVLYIVGSYYYELFIRKPVSVTEPVEEAPLKTVPMPEAPIALTGDTEKPETMLKQRKNATKG